MTRLALLPALAALAGPALSEGADTPLGVDPAVHQEILPNGFRVIVRENSRPRERAELRLVVKAGSIDEDDAQRGLAHFVEHMLFNGTESWAGNEIVDYLESIGAGFGADLNAYTSFDETVYMLEVPTDTPGPLLEGIRILGEFAWKATFVEEEIEKERGVVLDEWRRGLGAGQRVRDRQLPVVLRGSRYAERLPIGLPEVIEAAPPETIRSFYRDWYVPGRMAAIAVGDFDGEEVLRALRETFGDVLAPAEPRPRVDADVPAHADTLFALADDPELRGTTVSLSVKRPPTPPQTTAEAYREDLVTRLATSMVNARLSEMARSENPPFLGAGLGIRPVGRAVEITGLSARVHEGREEEGLRALLREASRARMHGFQESEILRARSEMLSGIEATFAEREKTPSGAYVSEYTRHFLHEEPIPGIAAEVELWRAFLPEITAEECHRAIRELLSGDGVVVEASRPTREKLTGEEALRTVLREASAADVPQWTDQGAGSELTVHPCPAGSVVQRREVPVIGATELILSNGVRVVLKPTDFQDDEIRFAAHALGGTSVAPDSALASARNAVSIVAEAGWGGHSRVELGKVLAGKVAQVSPFFDERFHGVTGSSTVADLPTALELAVLMMTAPNRDPAAFQRFLERARAGLANRAQDPAARYRDRVVARNTMDHPRTRPMTVERLGEIDLDAALAFYKTAFSNAADFAFFLAGNVDVERDLPLLETWLGSLPGTGAPSSSWVPREIPFPEGSLRDVVRAGREPRGHTTLTYLSYDGQDPREWHRIRTACSILQRRLRESLREDLGATYGVSVGYDFHMIGPNRGTITIAFGSDPERSGELQGQAEELLGRLVEEGPEPEEVAKEREIQTRDMETALRTNGYWVGALASLWMRQRPPEEISSRLTRIQELNVPELHRVFREHFDAPRRTAVIWRPEEETAP